MQRLGNFTGLVPRDLAVAPMTSPALTALLVIGATTVALGAGPRVKFPSRCTNSVYRPHHFVAACADAGLIVKKIRWHHYGSRYAKGRGEAVFKTCDPDCASGGLGHSRAKVRLYRPRRCPERRGPPLHQGADQVPRAEPPRPTRRQALPVPLPDAQLEPKTEVADGRVPAPETGIVLTHFIVSDDVERSRRFYTEVLGGEAVRAGEPTFVALANSWIIINVGGGPTDDKPTVTLETPPDPDRTSSFLNIRVADIEAVYSEWSARGAEFLTPPKHHEPRSAATSAIRMGI